MKWLFVGLWAGLAIIGWAIVHGGSRKKTPKIGGSGGQKREGISGQRGDSPCGY